MRFSDWDVFDSSHRLPSVLVLCFDLSDLDVTVYVCACICVCICIYLYICIYVSMHICIVVDQGFRISEFLAPAEFGA